MHVLRLSSGLGLAIVITLSLFVLMSALIKTDDAPYYEPDTIDIKNFVMPERKIEVIVEEGLPDKLVKVQTPPDFVKEEFNNERLDTAINVNGGIGEFDIDIKSDVLGPVNTELIPVYVASPDYPRKAKGSSGYAVVTVTVTETGAVSNVALLEESPANKGFGKSALKAAKKLKYTPCLVEGVAVPVHGVKYKFSYEWDQ